MKMFKSFNQDEPITREAALYEEFSNMAKSQCVSDMTVRDWFATDSQVADEINRSIESREIN